MLHRPLLAVAATLLLAAPAAAQTPTLSFHLAPQDSAVEGLAADCGTSFADPLNQSGRLVQRASSEVAEVMSDCTSEVANASFSRECELAMATSTVDYIVIVEADEDGDEWYFRASVLSPLRAATVWSDDVFASGTRRRATVDGCEELGSRFVAHLGFGEVQDVERTPDSEPAQSVLEVLDTTPTLVEVWIDGVHAGMSGGQLIVPAGDAQIELRATGYQTHGQPVTFSEGQVLTLRGIALPALPAQLVVVSNVVGAQVLVDDVVVGTTPIGGALEVDVPTTARALRVTRDGYADFDTSLSGLVPGQQRQFDVELRAAVPEQPRVDPEPIRADPVVATRDDGVEQARRNDRGRRNGGLGLAEGFGRMVDSMVDHTMNAEDDPMGLGLAEDILRTGAEIDSGMGTAGPSPQSDALRFSGSLARGDDRLNSGEFRDLYTYQGRAGEAIEVVMRSTQLDSYLMVRGPSGFSYDNDDGLGANARMVIQLPESGEYTISATSKRPGEMGSYTVEVNPASVEDVEVFGFLPVGGSGTLARGDSTLQSGEYVDSFAFFCTRALTAASAAGACAVGSTVEVTMTSREFDTYVFVRGPNNFSLDNDDHGRGTDARLSFRVPSAGVYRVNLTSSRPGETGTYEVVADVATSSKWD